MKPVLASLRKAGNSVCGYLDDILLMSDTCEGCQQNVSDTIHLLQGLEFTIHTENQLLNLNIKYNVWDLYLIFCTDDSFSNSR